ncbi:hypothetical protein ACQJBY_031691 [Aegilops geniculata]
MAASTERPCQSGWPNLRRGLLRKVLSRLPSLADRVRLRAVCRPWRTRAALQPPPRRPLPWLALPGGTVLDFANKSTHRLRIPDDDGGPCYSAGDNMFFLHHNDGRCFVVNGFSGAATPLPELAALLQSHMVFEADLRDGPRLGQWKKARSLQGRALFVGMPCSKSFRACDVDGAQGDCIYFLVDHGNPLRHSAVYNMVNKTIMPLIPVSVWRSVKLTWDSQRFPAWFFPVEV